MNKIEVEQVTATKYRATERLYFNADRSKVVQEGDPEAASLFTTPGKEISAEDAERFGLIPAKAAKADKAEAPETKAEDEPAENKAKAAPENKAKAPRKAAKPK